MNQGNDVLYTMKYNYDILIRDIINIINKVIMTLVLKLYYHLLAIERQLECQEDLEIIYIVRKYII